MKIKFETLNCGDGLLKASKFLQTKGCRAFSRDGFVWCLLEDIVNGYKFDDVILGCFVENNMHGLFRSFFKHLWYNMSQFSVKSIIISILRDTYKYWTRIIC